jgi:hypothetical protein
MRLSYVIPAALALFISGAASAQTWEEYVNRTDFFSVNMPGEPTDQAFQYKTAKGTTLPAHLYTARDARGNYTITVVDYSSAEAEIPSAIDEAVATIKSKGTTKYEGVNMLDNHRSWRITVETPQQAPSARRSVGGREQAPLHLASRHGVEHAAAGAILRVAADFECRWRPHP